MGFGVDLRGVFFWCVERRGEPGQQSSKAASVVRDFELWGDDVVTFFLFLWCSLSGETSLLPNGPWDDDILIQTTT